MKQGKRHHLPPGAARLTSWNLDLHDFRAVITLQRAQTKTWVSPRGSLYFCGLRLSDFHGLLVNVDPASNVFRLWDLDAAVGEGAGTRFLDQWCRTVWVSAFSPLLHRVQPAHGRQVVYDLGSMPAGLAVMPDGAVMMPAGGVPAGKVLRLSRCGRRLTVWSLPEEAVPFGGVATPHGHLIFSERRLARVADFDPARGLLREWQLPPGSNPQVIARDRLGRVWLSDANFTNRIGRLDLRRNRLALFIKPGVVTFSVRPVDRFALGRVVAAADLASSIDLIMGEPTEEISVPRQETLIARAVRPLRCIETRVPLRSRVIRPHRELVTPSDPPGILRYHTPIVAPIDVAGVRGAVYATAGVLNEHKGPSRLFRLDYGRR